MLKVALYSDLLCVWAWGVQSRLDIRFHSPAQGTIESHFFNLFGDTNGRIAQGWANRGGFEGFAKHTKEVVEQHFPQLNLHPDVWINTQPTSSMPAHLYLKAASLVLNDNDAVLKLSWLLREHFFAHGKDISNLSVIEALFQDFGIDMVKLQSYLQSGHAHQALWADEQARQQLQLQGSPSVVFDGGRQILYGNISQSVFQAAWQSYID